MSLRLSLLVFLAAASPAVLAHPEGAAGGLLHGLAHPFAGLDHLLAMATVGIWAARFSGVPRWLLPGAFVSCMALGAALGGLVELPLVEPTIALSVLVIGLAVAFAVSLPIWAGAIVVGAFALYHGYAHFTEIPHRASVAGFAVGMLLATAVLHLAGLAAAWYTVKLRGWLPRALGGAVSAAGAWLLVF